MGRKYHGNEYYLNTLDYLYDKNQKSAIKAPRDLFYNIAQQVIREFLINCEHYGPQEVFDKMKLYYRNGRPSYARDKKDS